MGSISVGAKVRDNRTFPLAPTSMPNRHLYTFGYEGLDIDSFVSRLQEAKIDSVVDVRELPLSRKKGFSKTSFRERLATAGIAYFHVPALGCPKPIRNEYRESGDWAVYTRRFLVYLKSQTATVEELAKFARTTSACLVCFEADFSRCHRTFVARAAKKAGGPAVKHLTAGTTVLDQALRLVA